MHPWRYIYVRTLDMLAMAIFVGINHTCWPLMECMCLLLVFWWAVWWSECRWGARQDDADWGDRGGRCVRDREDLEDVPVHGRHRLRLLLLQRPHRNPGTLYFQLMKLHAVQVGQLLEIAHLFSSVLSTIGQLFIWVFFLKKKNSSSEDDIAWCMSPCGHAHDLLAVACTVGRRDKFLMHACKRLKECGWSEPTH